MISSKEKIHYFQKQFAYVDKSIDSLHRILLQELQIHSPSNVSPWLPCRLILVLGLCHLLLELQISLGLCSLQPPAPTVLPRMTLICSHVRDRCCRSNLSAIPIRGFNLPRIVYSTVLKGSALARTC